MRTTNHTHHKSHIVFNFTHLTQLTIRENQIIEVMKEDKSGWWQVGTEPKTSLYVANIITIIRPLYFR